MMAWRCWKEVGKSTSMTSTSSPNLKKMVVVTGGGCWKKEKGALGLAEEGKERSGEVGRDANAPVDGMYCHNAFKGLLYCIADGISDGVADCIVDGIADGIADGVADCIVDGVADGIADGIADGTARFVAGWIG